MAKWLHVAGGGTSAYVGGNLINKGIDWAAAKYVHKTLNVSNDALHLSKTVTDAIKNVHIPSSVSVQGLAVLGLGLATFKVALEKWLGSAKKDVV